MTQDYRTSKSLLILLFYINIFIIGVDNFKHERHKMISDSGLIFSKMNNVIINDGYWTIILELNVTDHFLNYIYLRDRAKSLSTLYNQIGLDNSEIKQLLQILDELVDLNKPLTDMLNTKRKIKQILNFNAIYDDTKFIFNFGSEIDGDQLLKKTTQKIVQLKNNQEKHFLNERISFTKILDKKIGENTKRIIDFITEIENEVHKNMGRIKQMNTNKLTLHNKFYFSLNLTSKFSLTQSEALHSLISANRLQNALEMASEGRLSSYLLSPKELQNELLTIKSLLPPDSKLFRRLALEDMYIYREMVEVTAMANLQQILIAIRIPLLSDERGFNLYTIDAMPIFNEKLKSFIKVEPESNYLIANDEGVYYGLPDDSYIRSCSGRQPLICSNDIFLYKNSVNNTANCIAYSFFNNKLSPFCKSQILLNDKNCYWTVDRANNGWIYSIIKPTTVTLNCDGQLLPKTIKLSGIGHLIDTSHCTINGDDFKLLKRTTIGDKFLKKDSTQTGLIISYKYTSQTYNEFYDITTKNGSSISDIRNKLKNLQMNINRLLLEVTNYEYHDSHHVNKEDKYFLPLKHHHFKLFSFSSLLLLVVCIVSSTVTSLVAVIVFVYCFVGRVRRQLTCNCQANIIGDTSTIIAGSNSSLLSQVDYSTNNISRNTTTDRLPTTYQWNPPK